MTKKLILVLTFMLILTGCTKTQVDLDLEDANKNPDFLTDEDSAELNKDPEFKEDYIEAMVEANDEQRLDESIALIDDLENAKTKKMSGQAKGSCNAITESSTCLEYYGEFWNTTQMELNCEGSGVFSFNPCPNDMAGGCNTGAGTQADMVAWMYLRGGGEMNAKSLKYAQLACDATLASMWLNAR
jgi:hypothetical protein